MWKTYKKLKGHCEYTFTLVSIVLIFLSTALWAQQTTLREVSGIVRDMSGHPLPGVTIQARPSGAKVASGTNGRFTILTSQTDSLRFAMIGFRDQVISVGEVRSFTVTMMPTAGGQLNEVVVVGYTTQKRANLTGAVSAISGNEILPTKNENLQNMVTGRLPGLRVSQRSCEPGSFDVSMDIRAMGTPLVVIDGIPRGIEDFQRLNPNDIENISILKDATAAVYGVRAANGVVVVTTKKGKSGENEISYSATTTFQVPSGMPSTTNGAEYMILRNEQAMHRREGANRVFSDEQINAYLSGEKQSTDLYDVVFKDFALQTNHNLNASGGS